MQNYAIEAAVILSGFILDIQELTWITCFNPKKKNATSFHC